jgi:hypothetical protein
VPSGNHANPSIMIEVVLMKSHFHTTFSNIFGVVIPHILTTNPSADQCIPQGSLSILLLMAILGVTAVAVDAYDPFESNVKAHFNVSTINKFHPTMSMSFAQVPNRRRAPSSLPFAPSFHSELHHAALQPLPRESARGREPMR